MVCHPGISLNILSFTVDLQMVFTTFGEILAAPKGTYFVVPHCVDACREIIIYYLVNITN